LLHRQEKKKESSLRKLIGTPANELTCKQNKLSNKASFIYDHSYMMMLHERILDNKAAARKQIHN
jgi:hypothetical protein